MRKTIQSQTVDHNSTINHHLSDELTEKEAHVNYLVTLFQALKSSGVQADAFREAFERIDLPVTNSKLSPNSINLSKLFNMFPYFIINYLIFGKGVVTSSCLCFLNNGKIVRQIVEHPFLKSHICPV